MMQRKGHNREHRVSLSFSPHAKIVHSSAFATIRIHPFMKESHGPVLVVTVPKKAVATAVKRNLLRRRYLHILRPLIPKGGKPVIVQCMVKKAALTVPFSELRSDIERSSIKISL